MRTRGREGRPRAHESHFPPRPEGWVPTDALVGVVLEVATAGEEPELLQAFVDGARTLLAADATAIELDGEPAEIYVSPADNAPAGDPLLELALAGDDERIGTLRIWRDEPLDEDGKRLAMLLCVQASTALTQARTLRREAVRHDRNRARLEGLSRTLASADPHAVAVAAVQAGTEILGALGGTLATLTADGEMLEIVASTGYPPEFIEPWRRFDVALPVPLSEAVRTAEPVSVTADDPLLSATVGAGKRSGHSAALSLPLLVDGGAVGAIAFTFDDADPVGEEDRAFLIALASTCAYAIDRERRERLHDQLDRLQTLTAELSRAGTPAEVARAVVVDGVEALGADRGAVATLDADGTLQIVASRGYPQDVLDRLEEPHSDGGYPLAEAARTGETVVLETSDQIVARFPALADEVAGGVMGALVALPLEVDGSPIGAIRFTFDEGRTFDESDRAFAQSLAGICSQALARALRTRQYDRTARLQELASRLAVALTPEDMATAIALAAVDTLGAVACGVAEATDRRTLRALATVGLPDDLVAECGECPLAETTPLGRAALSDRPVLLGSRREIETWEPRLADRLDDLGWNALAAASFRTSGKVTGGFLLAFAAEVVFTPEDEAFLETLANLFAQALDRARLHAAMSASRAQLHHLLDELQDGVVAVDRRLRVEFSNPVAAELLEASSRIGKRLPERWQGFPLRAFTRTLRASGKRTSEATIEVEDGRTYELAGVYDGNSTILVFRDVTAKEQRGRAEREFVVNAAHELRSPLAAIGSAVEALDLGAKDEAWVRDHLLSGISGEVERVNTLIHALLVLARSQADPDWLTLGPVEVEPLLVDIARRLEPKPGVRLGLDCPPDAVVIGERTLLAAAVANLAENAVRHTESGTITISCTERDDGTRAIAVEDTGTGIPEHEQPHVFERFHRADESTAGYGVGLAIVRAMAKALGGAVDIKSQQRKGTRISIILAAP